MTTEPIRNHSSSFFTAAGITIEWIMTGYGSCYKSSPGATPLPPPGTHKRIRP
jgi:hypothetical protein